MMEAPESRNPQFNDGLVVWRDEYGGRYGPPPAGYSEQFDLQWKLARDGVPGYADCPGGSTDPAHVADRIYQWTGKLPEGGVLHAPSCRLLDHPIDEALIMGRKCIDVGCGLGRWTKTMLALGADSVLSVDVSENSLAAVKAFNPNVRSVNVMRLPEDHPDLVGAFDFANFWGVAMHTEDPRKAFANAALTVKPGGALYLMVYCPTSGHANKEYIARRRKFHALAAVEQRLAYVDAIVSRRWDGAVSLKENVKNVVKNAIGRPRSDRLNTLDALEPYYNWVIPLATVEDWYRKAGFNPPIHLNEYEPIKMKSAFHMLGVKT